MHFTFPSAARARHLNCACVFKRGGCHLWDWPFIWINSSSGGLDSDCVGRMFFPPGERITAGSGSSSRWQCSSSPRPSFVTLKGIAQPAQIFVLAEKKSPTAWTCTFWTTGCGSPAYPRMAWLISHTLWLSWYFSGTEHGKDLVSEPSCWSATLHSVLPQSLLGYLPVHVLIRLIAACAELNYLVRRAFPRLLALVMFRNTARFRRALGWVCILGMAAAVGSSA